MLGDAREKAAALEIGEHALACDEAVEAAIRRRRVVVQRRVRVEDADHRQAVPQADLVVVEVVRGRDLHAAGAELGIDVFVGDDRDRAAGQRQVDALADQRAVALVVRVHRDGRVAEHRLGPRRRDDELAAALDGVTQVPELAALLAAQHLEIR